MPWLFYSSFGNSNKEKMQNEKRSTWAKSWLCRRGNLGVNDTVLTELRSDNEE